MSIPNSSRKNRLPITNCRAMASAPGMLVSASTHMPPTGMNCPAATFSLMRANRLGYLSLIHAYCCAEEHAKRKSGCRSIKSTMLEKVRAHLRTVSRTGHSQAESICA
ncbi:Uncharacterised protein [Mycobacteroides abscessus subsp. abscessus]|nr:Uncharacterised protein [Mycobacteroides abscessus subsp. abscessus]